MTDILTLENGILIDVKERLGNFALADFGIKAGRFVYHVPSSKTVPARTPSHRRYETIDGNASGIRKLSDAREFMKELHESGILDDEPATSEQIKKLKGWMEK